MLFRSQHCGTHCDALQPVATLCNTVQHTATAPRDREAAHARGALSATHCSTAQPSATHCNTLQHTTTHCNTLQHTATQARLERERKRERERDAVVMIEEVQAHSSTLHHTATHCNPLQHTATRCNTLLHTATHPPRISTRSRRSERINHRKPIHLAKILTSKLHILP